MIPSEYWRHILQVAQREFASGRIDVADFQAVVDVAIPRYSSFTARQPDGSTRVFLSNGYSVPEGAPVPQRSEGFTAEQALFALLGAFGLAGRAGSGAKKAASVASGAGTVGAKPAENVLKKTGKKTDRDGAASDAGRKERAKEMFRDRAKDVARGTIPAVGSVAGVLALKEYFPEIWQKIVDFLQPLVDALNDIFHDVRTYIPYIAEQLKLLVQCVQDIVKLYVENLGDSLKQLRTDVLVPWLSHVHEGMEAISKLQTDLAASGQRSDSSDPQIVAPNYTAQDLMRMSIAMNTPFVRDLARGVLNAEQILRYQAATSRGYGNPLDAWLAAGSTVNPASAASGAFQALETAARVPEWFVRR